MWLLLILSLFVSIPCTVIAGIQILKNNDIITEEILTDYPYISKISVGNFFMFSDLVTGNNLELYADIVVYLNAAGVLIILLFNIYLKARLYSLNKELDDDSVSPSDFTLMASGLSIGMPQNDLKDKIEAAFKKEEVKVAYINYAYNI
jgi:hypothetical protein